MEKVEKIKEDLKKILSERRFNHSVNVMEKCIELAKRYGVDEEKAALVGIAHDIAKEMSINNMFDYVEENGIEIDDIEKSHPALLHAKIGADMCIKKYNFTDDMANAIRSHTTGQANMSDLAKILYISDAISKERTENYVEEARKLADKSLNEATIFLLETFIKDCRERNKKVHPDAILAVESLKS